MTTQEIKEATTRIRIYGKELERWTAENERGREVMTQVEYAYRDYSPKDEVIATGSEDFSAERNKTQTLTGWIYTWDGERRNKGGYRWFDCRGYFRIRKSDRKEFMELMKTRYNAELVEFRR